MVKGGRFNTRIGGFFNMQMGGFFGVQTGGRFDMQTGGLIHANTHQYRERRVIFHFFPKKPRQIGLMKAGCCRQKALAFALGQNDRHWVGVKSEFIFGSSLFLQVYSFI